MVVARGPVLLAALTLLLGAGHACAAQRAAGTVAAPARGQHTVSFAFTFDPAAANLTTANRFWFTGGSAELNAVLVRGFGVTASFTGLQAGNSSGGVPVNLVAETFGPSYSLNVHRGKHSATLFVHGLIGEANGFSGVYPRAGAPDSSANAFAARVGGGMDLNLSRHVSVRPVEANWLRTQLPNSTTNIQNDLELGAGIVFHTAHP